MEEDGGPNSGENGETGSSDRTTDTCDTLLQDVTKQILDNRIHIKTKASTGKPGDGEVLKQDKDKHIPDAVNPDEPVQDVQKKSATRTVVSAEDEILTPTGLMQTSEINSDDVSGK